MRKISTLPPEVQRMHCDFINDLQLEHISAGKPSYRWLADQSVILERTEEAVVSFSKTTVSRVLKGMVEPRWDFVMAFLRTLKVPARTITEKWRPRWAEMIAMMHADDLAAISMPAAGMPPGYTCTVCGCWVTDKDVHEEWHKSNPAGTAWLAVALEPPVPASGRGHLRVVARGGRAAG